MNIEAVPPPGTAVSIANDADVFLVAFGRSAEVPVEGNGGGIDDKRRSDANGSSNKVSRCDNRIM